MSKTTKTIAIISGASSGLGEEFAKQIDARGAVSELWLIARRKDRLEALAKTLKTPCQILDYDLTDVRSLEKVKQKLLAETPQISWLINNAGFGVFGSFLDADETKTLGQIDLNCRALVALTHTALPYCTRGSRILQIASSAAFMPIPYMAIYAATKSFVLSFSLSLSHELKAKGISVTSVCPGPVETEFFTRASEGGPSQFEKERNKASSTEVVKLAIIDALKNKKTSIYGASIKSMTFAGRLLPYNWLLKASGAFMNKRGYK